MSDLIEMIEQFDDVPEVKNIAGLWNTLQEVKAALSQQEVVAWIVQTDQNGVDATVDREFAEFLRAEGREVVPCIAAPPSTAQEVDVTRDDVIQCIFATHKQSEGVMADAILSLFNQPTPQPAKVPQSVEEFIEQYQRKDVPGLFGIPCVTVPELLAFMSGKVLVPTNNIRAIERTSDQSVKIVFPSCRSASEFINIFKAAKGE